MKEGRDTKQKEGYLKREKVKEAKRERRQLPGGSFQGSFQEEEGEGQKVV
jgi:hypothetical protein